MDSQEEVEWCDKEKTNGNDVRFSLVDFVKEGQHFISKTLLKAAFEICAMKHNFDYKLVKSDKKVWYIRCADDDCSWRVRAELLTWFILFYHQKVCTSSFMCSIQKEGFCSDSFSKNNWYSDYAYV